MSPTISHRPPAHSCRTAAVAGAFWLTQEITVANLGPNRRIGDAFHPDRPLKPSGLIGPVQLLEEK